MVTGMLWFRAALTARAFHRQDMAYCAKPVSLCDVLVSNRHASAAQTAAASSPAALLVPLPSAVTESADGDGEFQDPITGELIIDPVVASDGVTTTGAPTRLRWTGRYIVLTSYSCTLIQQWHVR